MAFTSKQTSSNVRMIPIKDKCGNNEQYKGIGLPCVNFWIENICKSYQNQQITTCFYWVSSSPCGIRNAKTPQQVADIGMPIVVTQTTGKNSAYITLYGTINDVVVHPTTIQDAANHYTPVELGVSSGRDPASEICQALSEHSTTIITPSSPCCGYEIQIQGVLLSSQSIQNEINRLQSFVNLFNQAPFNEIGVYLK